MSSISNLITVATFSGQSKFSNDFQQILNRAVQLQSLKLQSLQFNQQDASNRLSAAQSLDAKFASLQSAVTTLASSVGQSSLAASVANPAIASVTLGSSATTGVYSLEVDDIGAAEQVLSNNGLPTITDPNSQTLKGLTSFSLSVNGGAAVTITPSSPSLQSLVSAINANSSTYGVTASLVNVGSTSAPDYRLSLQSTTLGAQTISLSDPNDSTHANLLSEITAGRSARYVIDGHSVTSNTASITLAPGVTANLLQTTGVGVATTITVNQTTNSLQQALQGFATAYNAVVDELAKSHGKNAGPLSGDSILYSAQQALQSINGYTTSSGAVRNLNSLGLNLDTTGHITFNSANFQTAAASGFASLANFVGDTSRGFIQAATSALQGLEDPLKGALRNEESTLTNSITRLNTQINSEVDRINTFQDNLVRQLAQSDALIVQLQSTHDYLAGLFSYATAKTN